MATVINTNNQEDIREDYYVRGKDLRKRFSVNNSTLWRWIKAGKLPQPQYLNGSRVWLNSEILLFEHKMLTPTLEWDLK